ncbi:hypothetical protein [Leptolyngbya sp. KIOST-1]|uniref:hypothetical protein n=1 Tax=Leptolyngbya sp. KIOST-1 TaxID=1229172 RepID=UPI0012E01C19|nr:hypothetical protein [Leptolyngbya sp. KIOST-1]
MSINQTLKSLNGAVVVIQSLRNPGNYVDAHNSKEGRINGCPRSNLVDAIWTKFILHHIQNNIVCLEAVRYPDHYFDMNTDKPKIKNGDRYQELKLTHFNVIPRDQDWALFSIFGEADLSNVGIRSERWTDRWWDAHTSKRLLGAKHDRGNRPADSWGKFEISFPALPEDRYELVASKKNETSFAIDHSFSYESGVSRTDSKGFEESSSLSLELQKNFGVAANIGPSASAKFTVTNTSVWKSSTSETFSMAKKTGTSVTVPPDKGIKIYQLQGRYGSLNIGTHHFRKEEYE